MRSPHSTTTAPSSSSSSRPRPASSDVVSMRYRSTCASCTRPGYTRTSWNVGLATGAEDPMPRATPRTNVVFPAPSSPVNSTMSPACIRLPTRSPKASVSAGDVVIVSGKVVVAAGSQPYLMSISVDRSHGLLCGHDTERTEARLTHLVLGPDANELDLLATCK